MTPPRLVSAAGALWVAHTDIIEKCERQPFCAHLRGLADSLASIWTPTLAHPIVTERAGGLCECCGVPTINNRWELHHIFTRGRCPGWAWLDYPGNLAALRPECQRAITGQPGEGLDITARARLVDLAANRIPSWVLSPESTPVDKTKGFCSECGQRTPLKTLAHFNGYCRSCYWISYFKRSEDE